MTIVWFGFTFIIYFSEIKNPIMYTGFDINPGFVSFGSFQIRELVQIKPIYFFFFLSFYVKTLTLKPLFCFCLVWLGYLTILLNICLILSFFNFKKQVNYKLIFTKAWSWRSNAASLTTGKLSSLTASPCRSSCDSKPLFNIYKYTVEFNLWLGWYIIEHKLTPLEFYYS